MAGRRPSRQEVNRRQVALGADRVRTLLTTRLRGHVDVRLVTQPVEQLTPAFLDDLGDVAEQGERAIRTFAAAVEEGSPAAMPARAGLFLVYCAIPDWDSATARFETLLAEGPEQGLVRETLDDLSVLRELHAEAGPRIDPLARRLRDMVHDQE